MSASVNLLRGAARGMAPNPEQAALRKLTTNWCSLIEDNLFRRR